MSSSPSPPDHPNDSTMHAGDDDDNRNAHNNRNSNHNPTINERQNGREPDMPIAEEEIPGDGTAATIATTITTGSHHHRQDPPQIRDHVLVIDPGTPNEVSVIGEGRWMVEGNIELEATVATMDPVDASSTVIPEPPAPTIIVSAEHDTCQQLSIPLSSASRDTEATSMTKISSTLDSSTGPQPINTTDDGEDDQPPHLGSTNDSVADPSLAAQDYPSVTTILSPNGEWLLHTTHADKERGSPIITSTNASNTSTGDVRQALFQGSVTSSTPTPTGGTPATRMEDVIRRVHHHYVVYDTSSQTSTPPPPPTTTTTLIMSGQTPEFQLPPVYEQILLPNPLTTITTATNGTTSEGGSVRGDISVSSVQLHASTSRETTTDSLLGGRAGAGEDSSINHATHPSYISTRTSSPSNYQHPDHYHHHPLLNMQSSGLPSNNTDDEVGDGNFENEGTKPFRSDHYFPPDDEERIHETIAMMTGGTMSSEGIPRTRSQQSLSRKNLPRSSNPTRSNRPAATQHQNMTGSNNNNINAITSTSSNLRQTGGGGGGRRKIRLHLFEDVPKGRGILGHFRERSRSLIFGSMEELLTAKEESVPKGRIAISWYDGTTTFDLNEHVRQSVLRKLKVESYYQLVDVRFLDESSDPPEEIVLSPYLPDGSEFVLRFSLRDTRSDGTITPAPESPSAAPTDSPHPPSSALSRLNVNQLALLRIPSERRIHRSNSREVDTPRSASRLERDSARSKNDDAEDETHSKAMSESYDDEFIPKPEDPIEARLRQITELLLNDREKKSRDIDRRHQKRQVIFVLANYFVLFLSLIAISAEIQARTPGWLESLEKQMRTVHNCAADKEALFQCVSNGDFAGLLASVMIWLTRSVATRRIFLFGFETPKKLWTVVYESLVTAFCWGFSYIFIRRGMNPDTRERFLQKYWKDAVYGSLAGFNAAFMKHVLKNLIPQEAVEDLVRERPLKILSWLPSFQ